MTTNKFSLHIINKMTDLGLLHLTSEDGDKVLFIQDAVYRTLSLNRLELANTDKNESKITLYVREMDCDARGITPPSNFEVISDDKWVELCEQAQNVISW